MVSLGRLNYIDVVAADVLNLAFVILPPCYLGLFVVLQRVEAAGVIATTLNIVTLGPTLDLGLLRGHQLVSEIGYVRIDARVVLLT